MDVSGRTTNQKLHSAISDLRIGDELKLVGRDLKNRHGFVVGRLSNSCTLQEGNVISVKVSAIASRYEKLVTDPAWRARLKMKSWETVLCTIQTS